MSSKTFCDDCLTAAYDEVGEDSDEQIAYLDTVSYMMADHICGREETEGETPCDCEAH